MYSINRLTSLSGVTQDQFLSQELLCFVTLDIFKLPVKLPKK